MYVVKCTCLHVVVQELKTNINKNVITLTKFAEIYRNSPKFAENFILFFSFFKKPISYCYNPCELCVVTNEVSVIPHAVC